MKKLMIACAAALAAFAAAQAADVTSANIVGTQTITLKGTANGLSGYNMIAINWDAVGGTSLDLATLFSDDDLAKMKAGTIATAAEADQIMIWNPTSNGYTTYYLRMRNNGTIMGWADDDNAVQNSIPVAKGSAFWFLRQGSTDISVTIKGEVSSDASVPFIIKGNATASGYNMLGAGYPVDLMLNDDSVKFAWEDGTAGTIATAAEADQIMIWNPATNGYVTYYLRMRNNGTVMGWADDDNVVNADAKIPAGAAAWYLRQTASDITVSETTPLD